MSAGCDALTAGDSSVCKMKPPLRLLEVLGSRGPYPPAIFAPPGGVRKSVQGRLVHVIAGGSLTAKRLARLAQSRSFSSGDFWATLFISFLMESTQTFGSPRSSRGSASVDSMSRRIRRIPGAPRRVDAGPLRESEEGLETRQDRGQDADGPYRHAHEDADIVLQGREDRGPDDARHDDYGDTQQVVPAPEPVGHDVVPGLAGVGSIPPVPQEQLYQADSRGSFGSPPTASSIPTSSRLTTRFYAGSKCPQPGAGSCLSIRITVVEERQQISYLSAFSSDADLPPGTGPSRLRARSPGETGRRRRAAVRAVGVLLIERLPFSFAPDTRGPLLRSIARGSSKRRRSVSRSVFHR